MRNTNAVTRRISFAGLSMASLASECPLMMAWAQASVSESNLHPTLNQINESGTLGDAGHIETKRHLTQEQIKLFTRLSTRWKWEAQEAVRM